VRAIVVGGGKLAYYLSRALIERGHAVAIINRTRRECVWLARRLAATVVLGDGSDPRILEEAGAPQAHVVLAVTPNDEDNLVTCQLASVRFGVPRALALVNDPDHEETFSRLGVTAVSTTRILSRLLEQRMAFDDIAALTLVAEGQISVAEIVLDPDAPVVGRALRDLVLPENALIGAILRRGRPIIPRGDSVLRERDRLVVIALPENQEEAIRRLTGESDG